MKITFVTTSTFSDVQKTQSECIKKWFPNSEHIIIDGRTGWFSIWYKWLEVCKNIESDWFIHIDEDCFITDSYPILDKIRYMEEREYDICGPSDGCHEYRSGNHVAFNSFFLIMNKKCIDTWNDWISWNTTFPQFNKDWEMEFPFQKRNKSNYTYDQPWNVWVPNTEPYYNFFWVLKENEIKFHYLDIYYEPELSTSNLLESSVIHAWHQRERNLNRVVSPIHKYPNNIRYDMLISNINKLNNFNEN